MASPFSTSCEPSIVTLELDVRAVGEALLDGDLLESRFRTAQVVAGAETIGAPAVLAAATHLQALLHPAEGPPGNGVGVAFDALYATIVALYPPNARW